MDSIFDNILHAYPTFSLNDRVVLEMQVGMRHYLGIQALFCYPPYALEQFHSRWFDTICLAFDTPMRADQMQTFFV